MRNFDEPIHSTCDDPLDEIENCSIFSVSLPDTGLEPTDREYMAEGEFAISNSLCDEDPLILTRDELRRLGEQLIKLSEGTAT